MATFEDAYKKVVKVEGSYVCDSDDSGGETYKGISRRYNPKWEGWPIIDNYKKPLEIYVYGYSCSMGTIILCSGNKNPNVINYFYPFSFGLFHNVPP